MPHRCILHRHTRITPHTGFVSLLDKTGTTNNHQLLHQKESTYGINPKNVGQKFLLEALLSDCICFIDHDFDKNHYLMPEPFYVHNGLELNEKINKLKTDINYYNSMLAQQRLILQNIVNQNMPEKLYHTILGA